MPAETAIWSEATHSVYDFAHLFRHRNIECPASEIISATDVDMIIYMVADTSSYLWPDEID